MGGAEAWKNVDQTEAQCPKCNHMRAYFIELQTRSADELAPFTSALSVDTGTALAKALLLAV